MISVLESLLFVVGDEGLTESQLMEILEVDELTLNSLIEKLSESYTNRGIELTKLGNRYKLVTKKSSKEYIQRLMTLDDNDGLSDAALEVLAIIAYNQPITRGQVDDIRGVGSTYLVRRLVYKNLIHEVGRSETAGRPVLYGTTSLFLDYFGLKNINDLPEVFVNEKDEVVDLYDSKFVEVV